VGVGEHLPRLQIGELDVACLERWFRSSLLVLVVGSVECVVSDPPDDIASKRKHNSFLCVFLFCPSTAHPISKERGPRGGFGKDTRQCREVKGKEWGKKSP